MPPYPTPRVGGSDSQTPIEPESPTTPGSARKRAGAETPAGSEPREATAPGTADPATRERRVQRARDPEARKRALADAVIEIVAEVGIGRTTHRAVAARAGLPLGATTYYFPTLDDLIAAGLAQATDAMTADLHSWDERLRSTPDLAKALVELVAEYLIDRRRVQIEYELYVAAARDVELRSFALAWLDGLNDLLVPRVGLDAAQNISALVDGAMIQSVVTGKPLNEPLLTAAIKQLTPPAPSPT
ncbi:TetR family transcriptional regulator [Actinoplanes sp. TBRC 11911]|uniref:TetR/AcrR family transcriptional regulator n=1 Tax=Actinoplanes sp. TBRC 11911 TaxID=2729386 RepID=UPI00145CAC90|nr:TetR family transcriptional regulator [Actinoplanes sp. TBRC 11911]NMO50847.1 TetR family transcriptional regulator [Actinoplanes sp. TBRC 11911]